MLRRFRSLVAALAAAVLLVGLAAPASAGTLEEIDPNSVPPVLDLVVLRPVGLATTVLGVVAFVPAAALTAVFRPSDIDKPFDALVKGPFSFTFLDPLGSH